MSKEKPKYKLVEQHIKRAIKQKDITEKLPGERTLAKELGFSYMTIRKAVDNLVDEGVLYKVPTKGAFVVGKEKRKAKTRSIGYFLDSSILSGLTSPYYSLIFNALERETRKHGYSLIYFSEVNHDQFEETLDKVDGVIVSCFPRVEAIVQQIKEHVPVVVVDNTSSDKTIPSVILDNFNAIKDTFTYLHDLGHRRIAFMTGLNDSDVGRDRYAGYQNGLDRYGLKHDDNLIYRGNYTFRSGLMGIQELLRLNEPPTAVICANDSMALGAMRRLHNDGIDVPDDVSIVGFDDIDVAEQIVPALTTVKAPIPEMMRTAFELLYQLLQEKPIENRHIALPAKLIPRQTTAPAATPSAVA